MKNTLELHTRFSIKKIIFKTFFPLEKSDSSTAYFMESSHPPDNAPTDELDPSLVKLACQNRIKNRSKRSPEWIFFADAGMWQTVNGDESKFRIANCRYCLKADIQTKIRGKIETMKNHIMECDKIPASQKAVYERHPGRYRKRPANSANLNGHSSIETAKRQKMDGLLKAGALTTIDGFENKAVVLHGTADLRVDRVPIPSIPPGHVLIAMRSVGICGSDVHYWTHGRIGDFVVRKPMTLGHEGSGVVRLVGEDVHGLEEGDRVAIEPGIPCSACNSCYTGRYNLCPFVKFCATPPHHGHLSHFAVHKASFCYKLPPTVSFDEAALFEPLSVGIHACRRGGVTLGHKVLITGAGPIGLVCMLVAKASGASHVVIHDIDHERLQVAKELGADAIHITHVEADPKIVAEAIEADVCIDATGVESAVKTCIYGARRGGVVVLVGMGKPEISIPILDASIREVDLKCVFRYCNTYPTALQLVASGKVNVKRLVTHRFKMHDAEDAFEAARNRASKSIKVIIDCAPPPVVSLPPPAPPTAPSTVPSLHQPPAQPHGLSLQMPTSVAQQSHIVPSVAAPQIPSTDIATAAVAAVAAAAAAAVSSPPPAPSVVPPAPVPTTSSPPAHDPQPMSVATAAVAAQHSASIPSPVRQPQAQPQAQTPTVVTPAVVSAAVSAATSAAQWVVAEGHHAHVHHPDATDVVEQPKVDAVFGS